MFISFSQKCDFYFKLKFDLKEVIKIIIYSLKEIFYLFKNVSFHHKNYIC